MKLVLIVRRSFLMLSSPSKFTFRFFGISNKPLNAFTRLVRSQFSIRFILSFTGICIPVYFFIKPVFPFTAKPWEKTWMSIFATKNFVDPKVSGLDRKMGQQVSSPLSKNLAWIRVQITGGPKNIDWYVLTFLDCGRPNSFFHFWLSSVEFV